MSVGCPRTVVISAFCTGFGYSVPVTAGCTEHLVRVLIFVSGVGIRCFNAIHFLAFNDENILYDSCILTISILFGFGDFRFLYSVAIITLVNRISVIVILLLLPIATVIADLNIFHGVAYRAIALLYITTAHAKPGEVYILPFGIMPGGCPRIAIPAFCAGSGYSVPIIAGCTEHLVRILIFVSGVGRRFWRIFRSGITRIPTGKSLR